MDFHRMRVVSFDKKGIENDSCTKKLSYSNPKYVTGHMEKVEQQNISTARSKKKFTRRNIHSVPTIDADGLNNTRLIYNSKSEVLKVPFKRKLANQQKCRKSISINNLIKTFSIKRDLYSKFKKNSTLKSQKDKRHHKKCKTRDHHSRNKEVKELFVSEKYKLNRTPRKDLSLKRTRNFVLPYNYGISKSFHDMFSLQKRNSSRKPYLYCQRYDSINTNSGFLKQIKNLLNNQNNRESPAHCLGSRIKLEKTKSEVTITPMHNQYRLSDFFSCKKGIKKHKRIHGNVMDKEAFPYLPCGDMATGTSQSVFVNVPCRDRAVGKGDFDCTNDSKRSCACVHDENFTNFTQNCSMLRHNTQKAPNCQSKNTFWSSFNRWITCTAHTITNLLAPNKSRRRMNSRQTTTSAHPNPRKIYKLFYAERRGWMIKPIYEKLRKYRHNKKKVRAHFQDVDLKHNIKTRNLKRRVSIKELNQNTTLKFEDPQNKCRPHASCECIKFMSHLKRIKSELPSTFEPRHKHSGIKFPRTGSQLRCSVCKLYSDGDYGHCANQYKQSQSATKLVNSVFKTASQPDCFDQLDNIDIDSKKKNPHTRYKAFKNAKTGDSHVKHHHKRHKCKGGSSARPLNHSISKTQRNSSRNYRSCLNHAKLEPLDVMSLIDKVAHQKSIKDQSVKVGIDPNHFSYRNTGCQLLKNAKTGDSHHKHYPKQHACTACKGDSSARPLHHSDFLTASKLDSSFRYDAKLHSPAAHKTLKNSQLAIYRDSCIKYCNKIRTRFSSPIYGVYGKRRNIFKSHTSRSYSRKKQLSEKRRSTLCQKCPSLCCAWQTVRDVDNQMWKENIPCRDRYLYTLERKPWFWVYKICPKFYPFFLKIYGYYEKIAHMILFVVSLCFWCPLALLCYTCYHGCFKYLL